MPTEKIAMKNYLVLKPISTKKCGYPYLALPPSE